MTSEKTGGNAIHERPSLDDPSQSHAFRGSDESPLQLDVGRLLPVTNETSQRLLTAQPTPAGVGTSNPKVRYPSV